MKHHPSTTHPQPFGQLPHLLRQTCKTAFTLLILCLVQACGGMDNFALGVKESQDAPKPPTSEACVQEMLYDEEPERMQEKLLGGMQSPQGTTQSMGSSADNTSPQQERWTSGPTINIKGKKPSYVEIFHIPRGERYLDYRVDQEKIRGNSGYTIRYVTGQSKAAIESLKNVDSVTSFEAALKANALGAAEVGASGKVGHDRKARKNKAQSENHSHAAIVVWSEVDNSCWARGRLKLSIKICLAPTSISEDSKQHDLKDFKSISLDGVRKAAEQGNIYAQNELGDRYTNGRLGARKDPSAARKWYEKAADRGYAPAQNKLGEMYASGQSVEKDDKAAIMFYEKAAGQGYAPAQNNLGWMYQEGKGVEEDLSKARHWYTKAAEQGYAPAQNNLGWMYYKSLGVEKDYKAAVMWFQKAAEQGYAPAQNSLGVMCENGQSVLKDLSKARHWYQKAAAQGREDAEQALARIGRS